MNSSLSDATESKRNKNTQEFLTEAWGKFSLSIVIAALVFYGTAFQLGYFSFIGPEFFSMAGPNDWLFATVFISGTFIGCVAIFTFFLVIAISRPALLPDFPILKRFYSTLALVAIFVLFVFIFRKSSTFPIILAGPSAIVIFLYMAAAAAQSIAEKHSSRYWLFLCLIYMCGALILCVGMLVGRYLPGRHCMLIASDGRFDEVKYLRSLGDGHLFRESGNIVFIPKDKILHMSCESPKDASK